MIGESIYHEPSDTYGEIDAVSSHPDGQAIVRVNDHWFFMKDCEPMFVAS